MKTIRGFGTGATDASRISRGLIQSAKQNTSSMIIWNSEPPSECNTRFPKIENTKCPVSCTGKFRQCKYCAIHTS